jgi:hypothetical protein
VTDVRAVSTTRTSHVVDVCLSLGFGCGPTKDLPPLIEAAGKILAAYHSLTDHHSTYRYC